MLIIFQVRIDFVDTEMLTPTDTTIDAEAYRPANITAIAETKQSRTNTTIPGLPEVASSILANTNMTTLHSQGTTILHFYAIRTPPGREHSRIQRTI